ncbi:MAG: ribosome maturation factor RimP [Anaerorhabdus sp.]
MDQLEKIKALIKPILESLGIRLYDLSWAQQQKDKILQIAIMKQDGSMDIETCSIVSEKISESLDETEIISHEYFLEVCSPGAEREIKDYNEFQNLVSAFVYVRVKHPVNKLMEFTGEILRAEENEIEMNYRDKALTKKAVIEKDNIDFCRLAVKL